MEEVKNHLYQCCLDQLEKRFNDLEQMAGTIRKARNEETKSSAGDKYETGRAMMQLEEDKILAQIDQNRLMKNQLMSINPGIRSEIVALGSLVQTTERTYFLSIALGKMKLAEEVYYVISPAAPIGRAMLGKKAKGVLVFAGREEEILKVY